MSVFPSQFFELKCLVKNIDVRLCTSRPDSLPLFRALVTGGGDIVLMYESSPIVVKRIPWFTDRERFIQAMSFNPRSEWLLVVTFDQSLFVIPAMKVVDQEIYVDCKWSLTDLIHFPKHQDMPEGKPTAVAWWVTKDRNQNALVGFDAGTICLVSLTDGRYITSCDIPESVTDLYIINSYKEISLLVTGESGRQWRMVLEKDSYIWPVDLSTLTESKSKSYSLKQLGVERLHKFKQRLIESGRRGSDVSEASSESSQPESVQQPKPELVPDTNELFIEPQHYGNTDYYTVLLRPGQMATLHLNDTDSAPVDFFKLTGDVHSLTLTPHIIFTLNEGRNTISLFDKELAKTRSCKEYNPMAWLSQFKVPNPGEKVLRFSGYSRYIEGPKVKRRQIASRVPTEIRDFRVPRVKFDECTVVTNCAIYSIVSKQCPVVVGIEAILTHSDIPKAQQICRMSNMKLSDLQAICGDMMIARKLYGTGFKFYDEANTDIVKRVLMFALSTDCKQLLKCIRLCSLINNEEMTNVVKTHLGNFAVMAHTETVLRSRGPAREGNIKNFMSYVYHEQHFDRVLALGIICKAKLWSVASVLAHSRGLFVEFVDILNQTVKETSSPNDINENLLIALSDSCFAPCFLIRPEFCKTVLSLLRNTVEILPVPILRKFLTQFDPSQPCFIPFVSRALQIRNNSNLDSTDETMDVEVADSAVAVLKDVLEGFILVLLHLIKQKGEDEFKLSLMEVTCPLEAPTRDEPCLKRFPDLRVLSCGFEHAALVRNTDVYTMGINTSGCLGTGPSLKYHSPAKVVQIFSDLKIKVLSVSCGRRHTLALTNFGVFGWGSNSHGQLGAGPILQESPHPRLIDTLLAENIIDVCCGQYHSLALTASGRVYTWGWGFFGQLGHGRNTNEYYPKLLDFEEPVMQIAGGYSHSVLLTADCKVYGFGQNAFQQVRLKGSKFFTPIKLDPMFEPATPTLKISSAYFHNLAVREDKSLFIWGSSPADFRMPDNTKKGKRVKAYRFFQPLQELPTQVTVGYRQYAYLIKGEIYHSSTRDGEVMRPVMRQEHGMLKFDHIDTGYDFLIGIAHGGKVFAWGNTNIKGALVDEVNYADEYCPVSEIEDKHTNMLINVARRPIANIYDNKIPIEVPGIPLMPITYDTTDLRIIPNRNLTAYHVRSVENDVPVNLRNVPISGYISPGEYIRECLPVLNCGQKTLHYVLDNYQGLYESDAVISLCLNAGNYQAAAKVAMLNGNLADSLGYQLEALKKCMPNFELKLDTIRTINKEDIDDVTEKIQKVDNLIEMSSPMHILSSSSSLDSIRQWGDDVEHQGGCESPCEVSEDVRQNMTQYVRAIKNESSNSPPISSVSELVDSKNKENKQVSEYKEFNLELADGDTKEIISMASELVEFYIKKIYETENHILMQNILMKCIEFWLGNGLPVGMLENVLLKNMDKYFYPLSILLFCKNFSNNFENETINEEDAERLKSASFLKQFSTKFCLQLCSMVLENVNKT